MVNCMCYTSEQDVVTGDAVYYHTHLPPESGFHVIERSSMFESDDGTCTIALIYVEYVLVELIILA